MQYGELIDTKINPEYYDLYNCFIRYFGNPIMIKIKDTPDNTSIYYTKINCLLGKYKRYLIIITKKDVNKIGDKEYMENLHWISLQTRELEVDYNIQKHEYTPRLLKDLYKQIYITERTKDYSNYNCTEYPHLNIVLLHDQNINSEYQYSDKGDIVNAIETYRTIFSFK